MHYSRRAYEEIERRIASKFIDAAVLLFHGMLILYFSLNIMFMMDYARGMIICVITDIVLFIFYGMLLIDGFIKLHKAVEYKKQWRG